MRRPLGWATAMLLVLLALAWQVRYAIDAAACADGNLMVLCTGPLDPWVLPLTLAIGVALVALGTWRLIAPRD